MSSSIGRLLGRIKEVGQQAARRIAQSGIFSSLDEHVEEVLMEGGIALAMKVAGAALSFAFNLLLARMLGAEGAGVYYLALTVTTVASVVGRLGLDNAALRFVASSAESGNWAAVKGVHRTALVVAGLTASVLTVLVLVGAGWISSVAFSDPDLVTPLRVMALGIVPYALLVVYTQALKGLKATTYAMSLQGFGVPLLAVPLLVILAARLDVVGAVLAWVLGCYAVVGVGHYLWRKATPDLGEVTGDFSTRDLLSTGFPLLLVASMNLIMSWTDTVMLGVWGASEQVGIYNASMKTAMLISFALLAVNSIAAPKFSSLYSSGEIGALGRLARDISIILAVIALPMWLACILAPETILSIFGPQFSKGAWALAILATGQLVNVCTGSVGFLLMMTGNERDMRNITVAVSIINVALNLLLVPPFGLVGAAIATSISIACTNVVATGFAYWRLSIVTLPLPGRIVTSIHRRGQNE